MNLLRAIFEFIFGVGWRDPIPPDLTPRPPLMPLLGDVVYLSTIHVAAGGGVTVVDEDALVDLLADCLRPTGDPLKKKHWYGRAGSPATPSSSCLRCGTPNPYKRPSPEHDVKP